MDSRPDTESVGRLAATGGTEPGQLRVAAASGDHRGDRTRTVAGRSRQRGPRGKKKHYYERRWGGERERRPHERSERAVGPRGSRVGTSRAIKSTRQKKVGASAVLNDFLHDPPCRNRFVQSRCHLAKSPPSKSRNQSTSLSFPCFVKCKNPEYQPAVERTHVTKKAHSYGDLQKFGFQLIHVINQCTLLILSRCRWL